MWKDVDEFTTWYIENKYPFKPPAVDPIYKTTRNSLNMITFRENRYQVELVLLQPNSEFEEPAEKTGVEQRLIFLNGSITGHVGNSIAYDSSPYVNKSNEDGTSVLFNVVFKPGNQQLDKVVIGSHGASLFSAQYWNESLQMSSLAKHKGILV